MYTATETVPALSELGTTAVALVFVSPVPAGTTTGIVLPLGVKYTDPATVPNPLPLSVSVVPTGPEVGAIEESAGADSARAMAGIKASISDAARLPASTRRRRTHARRARPGVMRPTLASHMLNPVDNLTAPLPITAPEIAPPWHKKSDWVNLLEDGPNPLRYVEVPYKLPDSC